MPGLVLTAGMKAFLGNYGKPLLFLIALGLAVVLIDQRGFNRAKQQDHDRELERAAIVAAIVGRIDADLDKRLATIAAALGGKIANLDKEKDIDQSLIARELARDPRLNDPNSCLSPGLLDAANSARGYPPGAELGEAGSADALAVSGSAAHP